MRQELINFDFDFNVFLSLKPLLWNLSQLTNLIWYIFILLVCFEVHPYFNFVFGFLNNLVYFLFIWRYSLNPASMISHYVFMLNLADCYDLSIDAMFLEILVNAEMDLNLLYGIHSLIQNVLHFEDLTEASFAKLFLLNEKSVVSVLFQIF